MMVKNEMIMLPKAIETARPLVDEIIAVDTGSTDGTRQWLAEQPGVQVFDYDIGEAIQSFSDVRNFSVSKAHCKYIVWMDACERFIDARGLRRLVEKEQYDVYAVPIAHANLRYVREKIVPREFCRFVDRVHEYIDVDGLRNGTTAPELGVIRDGYKKQNRESSESRNLRLLKKQIEEAPESPRRTRWLFYIARDLCDAQRFDEALPYLNQRVALEGFWEERYAAGVLLVRMMLYHFKDYVRADKTADALIALAKNLREGYYAKAECMYWQSQYRDAAEMYKTCIAVPRPSNATFWLWEEVYTWLPHDRLARIAASFEDVDNGRAEMQTAMRLAPPSEHVWMAEWANSLGGVSQQQPAAVS
jgi:glycosyltransferase involved in cell wall biosynthesis